jgi:hypothetical protein
MEVEDQRRPAGISLRGSVPIGIRLVDGRDRPPEVPAVLVVPAGIGQRVRPVGDEHSAEPTAAISRILEVGIQPLDLHERHQSISVQISLRVLNLR